MRPDLLPMTTTTQDFILGEPQVAGPLSVFPITGREPSLEYRTFAQAAELGAYVKELDGGASVGDLLIHNPSDLALLIFDGEEVLGAQQNRTFDVSALIGAGDRAQLPVSCVERGRWDGRRSGEHFAPAPQAADPSLRRVKRQRTNLRAEQGDEVRADQGEVWDVVDARIEAHKIASPSAAMNDVFDGKRSELNEFARSIRAIDGQLGAVAQVAGQTVALDVTSRADVFASLLPRLAQGYALEALDRPVVKPDEESAARFLEEAMGCPRVQLPTPGMGRGIAITDRALFGAGIEHGTELIQLSAFPADADGRRSNATLRAPRVAPPSRRRQARPNA